MRLLVGFTCIVMAVGCSDDDKVRHLPDAPPPPDADVDASTFGPVTLTILEGTAPQSGIRVVFQNADSSLVSDTTTGTDGKASAMMMPGGFVTAIDPFPSPPEGVASHDLRTFAGVKPGDQLRLFIEPFVSSPSINVNLTLPVDNNAVEYRVAMNCFSNFIVSNGGSGGPPVAMLQPSGCGPTSNLLVEAIGGDGQAISSIYKQSVALTDNGTIDLTADTYTAVPDVTFTYSNVPGGSAVSLDAIRITSLGRIFEVVESAQAAGGNLTFTKRIPTISNATAVTASSMLFSSSTSHLITEWGAPAASYALDFGGSKLPDFATDPQLDIAAHEVTWSTTGGAVQPDFARATVYLGREVPTQNWRWTVAAPTTTAVVLPVLPGASTFNPIEGDVASYDVWTGKVPGGYDAVRANILSVRAFQDIVLGATGKAAFNTYTPIGSIKPPAPTVPTSVLRGLRRR